MMTPYDDVLTKLSKNHGAILTWQVADAWRGAFEDAHADGAIYLDQQGDCYYHPHALRLNEVGAYMMFTPEATGGGCEALVARPGPVMVITDDNGTAIPADDGEENSFWLGIYSSGDAWSEGDAPIYDDHFSSIKDAVTAAQMWYDEDSDERQ